MMNGPERSRQDFRNSQSKKRAEKRPSLLRRLRTRTLEWLELRSLLAADVWTDKSDYHFNSTSLIGGSGFNAGESVQLHIVHADGTPGSNADPQNQAWTVQAGAGGDLNAQWLVNDPDAVNATYVLTATGLTSGLTAQ